MISFEYNFEKRYYVNSEGTKIIDCYGRGGIFFKVSIHNNGRLVYENQDSFRNVDLAKLPDMNSLEKAAKLFLKDTIEILKSPVQEPVTCPQVHDHSVHGTDWHEGFGHPSEASRHEEVDEEIYDVEKIYRTALTLKNKLGQRIARKGTYVIDNPSKPGFDGSYPYDAEGTRSELSILVWDGILCNFLHSRDSAGRLTIELGDDIFSTGNARWDINMSDDPMSRMANMFIYSTDKKSYKDLFNLMIKACRRHGKKYGLFLGSCYSGGISTTESYFHQHPNDIYRIYVNGREPMRMRGVYLTSTPLQIFEDIGAMSSVCRTENHVCIAESGEIPISTTAPAAFIKMAETGQIHRFEHSKRWKMLTDPPT